MVHRIIHKVVKSLLITLIAALVLVLITPALLYIPAIQDFAKDIALREVKKSTGMDVSIDFLRLKFPLRVSLSGVKVVEASGDTMATMDDATVSVRLMPLLGGHIQTSGIEIDSLFYRLGTPDSTVYLTALVSHFTLDGGTMNLKTQALDIDRAVLDGGKVYLAIKDTVTPEKSDTAADSKLRIRARELTLRRVDLTMRMLPVIDSLSASLPQLTLSDGMIDMASHRVHARALTADSLGASYFTPSAEYLKSHPAQRDTTAASASVTEPWTVTADRISISGRSATYAQRGVTPAAGFDAAYIKASHIAIEIDSFYNRAAAMRVPLRRFEATERCGLPLSAAGLFEMDTAAMRVAGFSVGAGSSSLRLDGELGVGDLVSDRSLPVRLKANGSMHVVDVERAFPSLGRTLRGLPRKPVTIMADIDGTTGAVDVRRLLVDWPSYLRLSADGHVDNPMDFNRMNGKINIDGSVRNVNFLKPTLLGAAQARQINIPPSIIRGTVDYRPNLISGNVSLVTGNGRVGLRGSWNGRATDYDAVIRADALPVDNFLPALGIGNLTADLSLKGHGYDPTSPATHIDANINLAEVMYRGTEYKDIVLDATLSDGHADGEIVSHNPGADLDVEFYAELARDLYSWDITGDIRELDLRRLGFATENMSGSMQLASKGSYSPKSGNIDAGLDVNTLSWVLGDETLAVRSAAAVFTATDSLTTLNFDSGDLDVDANLYTGLRPMLRQVEGLTPFIRQVINDKTLDVRKLQSYIPPLDLAVNAGRNNPVAQYLEPQGITFKSLSLNAHNDSLLHVNALVLGAAKDKMRLDTIAFDATQHGKYLVYRLNVDNKPGTMDDFAHVKLTGFVADDKMSFLVKQHNIKGEMGFNIGMSAAFTDTLVNVKMVPYKPVIAYQQWTLNPDNRIVFNFPDKHLDANLRLTNGRSLVEIFTDSIAGSEHAIDSLGRRRQEDVVVRLSEIHLEDWLSISPFAPPVKGDLGANLRFRWDKQGITGRGGVSLEELYYGRDRVGTFDINLDVANDRSGALRANMALLVDSVQVITAQGALNDSTRSNPFLLDFSMIRFPLRVVNPFLPKSVAQLRGMLNGAMKISGSMTEPKFDGHINFDSAAVKVGFTGVEYGFSSVKIPVDSNIVRFNDFLIAGLNGNDLHVNGIVDARHLRDVAVNMSLKARNMQIVNSSRPRGAELYGRGFIDLDATARGNLTFLDVNADLDILPETNVTYVLTSTASSITSRSSGNMVQFVQFDDTTSVASDTVQSSPMSLLLDANLTISEGSTINVDISADGKNKASIKGMGALTYTLNPMNDGRLTGRFTINSGFVRYTPPLMSEKNFSFEEGSYVAFNGDMLNPTLNIHAVDKMKANVTQEGQNSRLVNFLVSLSVTQTLQNMNVAFDLSTNDDITISNELQGMSAEQRANQAMNLLLYNTYTGPGAKGNANISGNPLFSFLESQINTWAANNIKFVDISFGIDQYDKTTDGASQTTTSYSYRVSKSLFNDRFKIVVGGNYSTDADNDESIANSLISDVSFEYMLNRSGSMYVRLFRHVGYESILEGEITQTGVGFVYRRKINSLLDLFRWGRKKKSDPAITTVKETTDKP